MDAGDVRDNKTHRPKRAGAKADKRKAAEEGKRAAKAEERGHKAQKHKDHRAFGVAKFGRLHKTLQRNADRAHRAEHAPLVDRTPLVAPPVMVVVVGPPGSGKSTLIKSLVKHYTRQSLPEVRGPISLVTGKNRRVTLLECPNDLAAMTDAAKIADLVLLTIDGAWRGGPRRSTAPLPSCLSQFGAQRRPAVAAAASDAATAAAHVDLTSRPTPPTYLHRAPLQAPSALRWRPSSS